MSIGLYMKNIEVMSSLGTFQPKDSEILRDITHYLHSIHVEFINGEPILHDIPTSSIIELRGVPGLIELTKSQLNDMLVTWMQHSAWVNAKRNFPNLIYYLYRRFTTLTHAKKIPPAMSFLDYSTIHLFQNSVEMNIIKSYISKIREHLVKKNYENDLEYLKSLNVKSDTTFPIRLYIMHI